jgi:hypothetical protein
MYLSANPANPGYTPFAPVSRISVAQGSFQALNWLWRVLKRYWDGIYGPLPPPQQYLQWAYSGSNIPKGSIWMGKICVLNLVFNKPPVGTDAEAAGCVWVHWLRVARIGANPFWLCTVYTELVFWILKSQIPWNWLKDIGTCLQSRGGSIPTIVYSLFSGL